MWTKPWGMTEGFLVAGGLVVAGLMLELSVGPVAWSAFAWPVNMVALVLLLLVVVAMHLLRRRVYAFSFVGTFQAAVPALSLAVVLTVVMGLTRQTVGGTWVNNMLTFWPFVLVYVYVAVILGLAVVRQLVALLACQRRPASPRRLFVGRSLDSLLFHLGLFVALVCATLGSADMQRLKMITAVGEPEWRALGAGGRIVEMPLAVELRRFIMETYDDGSPSRFASEVQILTCTGKNLLATIDVNRPVEVDGWKIYQYGYDTQMGAQSRTSILELISDPWLPAVYVGIYLMLAGAALMVLRQLWLMVARREWWLVALLGVVTAAILIFRPSYRIEHLMPALQSPWFAPHVLVYMEAYTLLGVACLLGIWRLASNARRPSASRLRSTLAVTDRLVYVGVSLVTVGTLFGALWAKEAWGHYWSWDPKETWAAITWFSYLGYVHYRRVPGHRQQLALWLLVVCFALLQMCWWGINYLPSAQGSSVHTYSV